MTYFDDVGNFHRKFGLPRFGDVEPPQLLEPDVQVFRQRFMDEELEEFYIACEMRDLPKAADALVDLVYVALGTAHMLRIPFDECWDAVQRANMAKERAKSADDERSTRKHRFDVVKPEGWESPNIASIIRAHTRGEGE